ncbi:hypothetical protein ACNHUS_23270 [Actinomycetes bacterium M1A6_2h]
MISGVRKKLPGVRCGLPVITLLVVAPVFGEVLSTSTAPLDLLLPWNLVLMVGMYGCGALLCRAVARRFGLGLPGLLCLGAAYGVYEEGLVDRFWYDPSYWSDTGIGGYSVVSHINVLIAAHLTVFHTAVSVVASIVLVEHVFPDRRSDSWIGTRGMALCGVAMTTVLFVCWEEFYVPPLAVLGVAALLACALVACAFVIPRPSAAGRVSSRTRSPRALALVAFLCTAAHFVSVYAVPSTGVWWPVGVALSLAPILVGAAWIRHQLLGELDSVDSLRIVSGIVGFFLALNVVIGLAGRYDMTVLAVALAVLMWRLKRRAPRNSPEGAP